MIKSILLAGVCFVCSLVAFAESAPKQFPGITIESNQLQSWFDSYQTNKAHINQVLGTAQPIKQGTPYVNSLIDSISPYLLRHAFNPIVWREWSSEALTAARMQEKLVFLSVGYSSCHWCHVMEKESFVDTDVAATINRSYIPIKVDKEVRPGLNHRYTLALELTTGSSGWPITAVLTPTGDVVYINAYMGKDELNSLLKRLAINWNKNPRFFQQSAKLLMEEVEQLTSLQGDLASINQQLLDSSYLQLESKFDWQYGGLKGAVKFPEPALLNLLLDRYQRQPDKKLREYISLTLDNLYQGNLYDHVYGGFYRYSTDSRYLEPHFEKMLYTQAHMIKVFAKAYAILKSRRYLEVAEQTLAFTDDWLLSRSNLFHSAVDADFNQVEGGYYLWTQKQKESFKQLDHQLVNWQSIGQRYLPTYPLSQAQAKALQEYTYNKRYQSKPFVDQKVIVAWNSLMVEALMELYQATNNEAYLTRSELVSNTLWEAAWDNKSKKLNRIIVSDRVQNDFNAEDPIELALTSLLIYQQTGKPIFLQRATELFKSLEKFQLEPEPTNPKLYSLKGLQQLIANDGEGFSPLVRFTRLLKSIIPASQQPSLNHKLNQLKAVVATRLRDNVLARVSAYGLLNDVLKGELKLHHYFAAGHGVATLSQVKETYALNIKLDEGWHVNSRYPLRKELIATEAKLYTGDHAIEVDFQFPQATQKKLTFSKLPLNLYEESFAIEFDFDREGGSNFVLELSVQACSDSICLLPEQLSFPVH